MKGLLLLADAFEDTEALASCDVLLRAGERITRVSMMKTKEVRTQCGLTILCDALFHEIDPEEYDYLILPGGKASFTLLNCDARVEALIDRFIARKKLVAAICAAPHLIGRKGYFKNREFTVYPGFEPYCIGGIYRRDLGVVRDDCFVTAKSMYYSVEFALEILTFLYGESKRKEVETALKGEA